MILLIDNYDSFTFNLVQSLTSLGAEVIVKKNDKLSLDDITALNPEKIIISPGPGTPDNSGICVPAIRAFFKKIPIFGVCLGHQCIAAAFGENTIPAKRMLHGMTARIFHTSTHLFDNLPNPMLGARYNSLSIEAVPEGFTKTAWDSQGEIMAISHQQYSVFGVQFHPESFMTQNGQDLIRCFIYGD